MAEKPPSHIISENMGSSKNRRDWEMGRDTLGTGGMGRGVWCQRKKAHVRKGRVPSLVLRNFHREITGDLKLADISKKSQIHSVCHVQTKY